MLRNILLFCFTILILLTFSCANAKNSENSQQAKEALFSKTIGEAEISFLSAPEEMQQAYDISVEQKLKTIKLLAVGTVESRDIASSILYQQLTGTKYTGSAQEWANFLDSVVKGLRGSGFEKLTFTLVGADDKKFLGTEVHKEYTFTGSRGGNEQVIYNLAVLSEDKTQMYILSVGGNEYVKADVNKEFKRLVDSFKIEQ